jgi:hypothetical protein
LLGRIQVTIQLIHGLLWVVKLRRWVAKLGGWWAKLGRWVAKLGR